MKAEWDYGLRGYTLELAAPVTMANALLKRVRKAFDDEAARGLVMTSTYRSGINIKFGQKYNDLLGQVADDTINGADWSKGASMFDFPSFRPTIGDQKRFNEDFCRYFSVSKQPFIRSPLPCKVLMLITARSPPCYDAHR